MAMELSTSYSVGFQKILNRPLSIVTPSCTSFLPPQPTIAISTRAKNHNTTSATTRLKKVQTQQFNDSRTSPRSTYHSTSYNARQSAIREIQQSSDFESALSRLGGNLNAQDLNVILCHFGNLNRLQDLSQLFDWMKKYKKINTSSYSSYIKFIGKSRNCLKALDTYNSIEDKPTKTNVSVCNSLLSCLVKNGKFETSSKLFLQMKQDGLIPDAFTYSTLLAGCIKSKDRYSEALKLIQELQHSGLKMDSVIYGTLIAVCASNKRCKEAEDYFKQMKNAGHSPNLYHYSSLLNAYSVDGDYKKADELFQEMKLEKIVPNQVILTTLLKVYVRGGLFEKSRELLTELESLGYAKDEMPYCLLMDGLAKTRRIDEAKAVFNEAMERNVKSDGYSHSIMISAFCRGGRLEEASQLARDFEAKHNNYDLILLNTMICAYCRAGEMQSVMIMLKKMDELSITPDFMTYHILIKYFCKEKVFMLAYQTTKDMYSKGHQPEEDLCSSLIFNLGQTRAYSEAFSVYNMMKDGKRPICKSHHEKILHILIAGRLLNEAHVAVKDKGELISRSGIRKFAKAYMKSGNITLINEIMKTIHGCGYKIDQELFAMAISRYIDEPEKKELLIDLLQWMPSQGYVVDAFARNLILKNSHLFGRQLVADILSKQHIVSKESHSLNSK